MPRDRAVAVEEHECAGGLVGVDTVCVCRVEEAVNGFFAVLVCRAGPAVAEVVAQPVVSSASHVAKQALQRLDIGF